jgi:dethiobiotin synthetase
MTGFFVTAAGTEIGKTFVTCALLRQLHAAGQSCHALKPIVSGFKADDQSDPAQLLIASGERPTPERIAEISPWRYVDPLSPDMAAARAGRPIDFEALVAFCERDEPRGLRFVEGVGGVMAPITEDRTVRDWAAALGFPAVLVVGSYLGALSHALTAAAAITSANVPLCGIVVNQSVEEPVPTWESAAALARFMPGVPIVVMPRLAVADAAATADLLPLITPYLGRALTRPPSS